MPRQLLFVFDHKDTHRVSLLGDPAFEIKRAR
jgi:hypothetical protein